MTQWKVNSKKCTESQKKSTPEHAAGVDFTFI